MTDLIKSMNPTAPLTTEALALGAAKVSAVGMVIGAIRDVAAAWYASTPEASAAAAKMVEQMTGQAQAPEKMAQNAQFGLYIAGFFILLQLVLAFVQWKKPNMVLPIIFLVLVIWALGMGLLALVVPAFGAAQPMWLTLVTVVTMVIAAVTHIASIRGASALDKIRTKAAQDY